MERALILGASHSEIPIIQACQSLGIETVTLGNKPDDVGHAISNRQVFADFSDSQSVLEAFKSQTCDYIVPGCNDFSYLCVSEISHELGIHTVDPIDVAVSLHHKGEFRRLQASLGLPHPRSVVSDGRGPHDWNLLPEFPWIVKPTDLSGGKGISVVHQEDEVKAGVELALSSSRMSHVILEEFLSGTMHGASFLIRNREVIWSFFDDEHYSHHYFMVDGTRSPSSLPRSQQSDLVRQISLIAKALNLVDGLFHTQVLAQKERAVIIEATRRCPGDWYPIFAQEASELNYALAYVQAFLSRPLSHIRGGQARLVIRRVLSAPNPGTIARITGVPPGLTKLPVSVVWRPPGSAITNPRQEKVGVDFYGFRFLNELERAWKAVWSESLVIMNSGVER